MTRNERKDTLLAVTILSTAMGLVVLCFGAGAWFAFRDRQWALLVAAGVMLIGTLFGTVVLILAAVRALQDEPSIEEPDECGPRPDGGWFCRPWDCNRPSECILDGTDDPA